MSGNHGEVCVILSAWQVEPSSAIELCPIRASSASKTSEQDQQWRPVKARRAIWSTCMAAKSSCTPQVQKEGLIQKVPWENRHTFK